MDEGRIAVSPEDRDIRREGRRIEVQEEGRVIAAFDKCCKTTLHPEFAIFEKEYLSHGQVVHDRGETCGAVLEDSPLDFPNILGHSTCQLQESPPRILPN